MNHSNTRLPTARVRHSSSSRVRSYFFPSLHEELCRAAQPTHCHDQSFAGLSLRLQTSTSSASDWDFMRETSSNRGYPPVSSIGSKECLSLRSVNRPDGRMVLPHQLADFPFGESGIGCSHRRTRRILSLISCVADWTRSQRGDCPISPVVSLTRIINKTVIRITSCRAC